MSQTSLPMDPVNAGHARSTARVVEWVLSVVAATVGLVYGFGFGMRVGGIFIGTLAALSAAAMGAILVDSVFDLWTRWQERRAR